MSKWQMVRLGSSLDLALPNSTSTMVFYMFSHSRIPGPGVFEGWFLGGIMLFFPIQGVYGWTLLLTASCRGIHGSFFTYAFTICWFLFRLVVWACIEGLISLLDGDSS